MRLATLQRLCAQLERADLTWGGVIIRIERVGEHLYEGNVLTPAPCLSHRDLVTLLDLVGPSEQLDQRLSLAPGVEPSFHRCVGETRVAGHAGVLENLVLDGNGPLEEIWMALGEAHPLGLALVKAEVAARSSPPFVVVGKSEPGVVQYSHDAVVLDAFIDEWEDGADVWLCRDVPFRFASSARIAT